MTDLERFAVAWALLITLYEAVRQLVDGGL